MRKHFILASIAAFTAVAAYAAPARRNAEVPQVPTTTEEVAGNSDESSSVSDFTKPLDEKVQGCGCGKPKKMKR